MGGCLAHYAAQGVQAYVACATRGDGVDAQIKDPTVATRETLGQVRSQELACTCERLGINAPIFLGYQDGDVDKVPVETAALQVARWIRELKPQVVVTHDPGGGYGHPDHIAVHHFTTRGFELASDPQAPGLSLPPFAPTKLYYTAFPRSFLEKIPAFKERRADIRGQQLGFVGVPDDQITTQVDIKTLMTLKLDGLACHRTQFEFDPETQRPKSFWGTMPEPQRSEWFGYERFVLARGQRPPTEGFETDLFAGLRE